VTLPNFFVIGAGKSGTTSLWRYLEQHPEDRNLAKPPPMPEGVREGLTEAYREDILKLQKLVGRDLSGWLSKEA